VTGEVARWDCPAPIAGAGCNAYILFPSYVTPIYRTYTDNNGYARVTIHKIETDQLRASRQMAEKLAGALAIDPTEREAFLRFARFAPVLIGMLVAAGVYLSILRLPRLSDLWEAGYGQVLLVKLGLVGAALLWGGFHHIVVRPRLERTNWVRRSLAGEGAVAMTILLLAAILVDSKPPPQPIPQPTKASTVRAK